MTASKPPQRHRGFRGLKLTDLADLKNGSAVTIGNFDGVHRGHQRVIRGAVEAACARDRPSIACTFDPHTRAVVDPSRTPPSLQMLEQRLAAIAALEVDLTVVIPFDEEVAGTSAAAFVDEFLVAELRVASLHVSGGFRFGHRGTGDVELLQRRGEECGFAVEVVASLDVDGQTVSSTRIRGLLEAGEVDEAAKLIGRPYALQGTVVRGAGRGHQLGIPTANLLVENGCIPRDGVYMAAVVLGDQRWDGVANIGVRPTFGDTLERVIEAHVLVPVDSSGGGSSQHPRDAVNGCTAEREPTDSAYDPSEARYGSVQSRPAGWFGRTDGLDLYGERVELELLARLRGERRFASAAELTEQIGVDIRAATEMFAMRRCSER